MKYDLSLNDIQHIPDQDTSNRGYSLSLSDISHVPDEDNKPRTGPTRYISDVLGGVLSGVHEIPNIPHDIVQSIQQGLNPEGQLVRSLGGKNVDLSSYIPKPVTPVNYAEREGVTDPNMLDKILQGGGSLLGSTLGVGGIAKGAKAIGTGIGAVGDLATTIKRAISPSIHQKELDAMQDALKSNASNIIDDLSGGKTLEENQKSAAQDIKNLHDTNVAIKDSKYKPITDKHGDESIHPYDIFNQELNGDSKQANLLKNNLSFKSSNLLDKFNENKTFNNAHKLQSQLGYDIRRIGSQKVIDQGDADKRDQYIMVRNGILKDIDRYFQANDPQMGQQYKDAANYHYNEVVPLEADRNIGKIATGKINNPKNLQTIFGSPSELATKISNQLGQPFKNKIVTNELGKSNYSDPNTLAKSLGALQDKRISSYAPPELPNRIGHLNDQINSVNNKKIELEKSTKNKNLLKKGIIGGSLITALGDALYHHI